MISNYIHHKIYRCAAVISLLFTGFCASFADNSSTTYVWGTDVDKEPYKTENPNFFSNLQNGIATTYSLPGSPWNDYNMVVDNDNHDWVITAEINNYSTGDTGIANITRTGPESFWGIGCIVFGNSGSYINNYFKSLTLSSTAFADKVIKSVNVRAAIYPFSAYYDPGVLYTVTIGGKSFTSSTFNNNISKDNVVEVNEQADLLKIKIENPQNQNVALYLQGFEVSYEDGAVEVIDPELVLPGEVNLEWSEVVKTSTDDQLGVNSLLPDDLEISIEPTFSPVLPPADASEEQKAKWMTSDSYYMFEPTISINPEVNGLTMKVPCSGTYKVTMQTKDGNKYFKPEKAVRTYNIYPTRRRVSINWQDVKEDPDGLNPTINLLKEPLGDRDWSNALVDIDCIKYNTYYKVSGEKQDIYLSPTSAKRTESAYKENIYDDSQYIHQLQPGFSHYNARGIDLTQGNRLHLQFEKNGAVSPEYVVTYSPRDLSVKVDQVFDNLDETEYFTIDGIRIEGRPTSHGIYICRRGNRTFKVHL